jgi:hypothetical protein
MTNTRQMQAPMAGRHMETKRKSGPLKSVSEFAWAYPTATHAGMLAGGDQFPVEQL